MKNTRSIIIQTAFEAIHKNGYHQLRIDKEIEKLGITKGAFYHYFNSKQELLSAVVIEKLGPGFVKPWTVLSADETNILDAIQTILQTHIDQSSLSGIKYGCMFNNLVHEVSVDMPEIRDSLFSFFKQVDEILETSISKGLKNKQIKPFVGSHELALLILSVFNGGNSMNKLYQKSSPYKQSIKAIIILLETIRE